MRGSWLNCTSFIVQGPAQIGIHRARTNFRGRSMLRTKPECSSYILLTLRVCSMHAALRLTARHRSARTRPCTLTFQ